VTTAVEGEEGEEDVEMCGWNEADPAGGISFFEVPSSEMR